MDYNITLIQPDTYNVKMDNVVKVEPPQESIVVKSTEEEQVIIPQDVLYNKVVVEKLELQTKEIEPSQSPQVVVADEGYDGLKQVNINAIGDYKRPSDWLEIPEMDGTKDEIYILEGVFLNGRNYIRIQISGIGTIDWGDGTTETFSGTNQYIEHTYDYSNLSDSSYTTHNYSKQALIHINGDRGDITYFNIGGLSYFGDSNYKESNIYQIDADVESSTIYIATQGGSITHYFLEIFNWKGIIRNTTLSYMFKSCISLRLISALNTPNLKSIDHMFYRCEELTSIPALDLSNVSTITNAYQQCYSLKTLPELDYGTLNNYLYTFNSCKSLIGDINLHLNKATNISYMLSNCEKINNIKIYGDNITSITSAFEGCDESNDIKIYSKNITTATRAFYGCEKLKSVYINTSKIANLSSLFAYCRVLESICVDTSSATNISNIVEETLSLNNLKLYNLGVAFTSSQTLSLSMMNGFTSKTLIELFNSIAPITITSTLRLGSTLQRYLKDVYVKDSGELYTIILPTSDMEVDNTKTYYTRDDITGEYTQFTDTTFDADTYYYELKTATWNRYDICESTDDGAVLGLTWINETKGWTIT